MVKTAVVIGGGIFGIASANHVKRALKDEVIVKLITVSEYAVFLPGVVRLPITKEYKGTILPLKDVVDEDVEIICDEAIEFTETSVTAKSGQVINFDVLILATGSKWPNPIGTTLEYGDNYKSHFEKQSENIKNAKHILFIGGGFVNCEVAGEIINKYKNEIESGEKKISIVQNSDKMLPDTGFFSDTLRKNVTKWFKDNKVNLYLSSRAVQSKENQNKVIINGRETVEADLVYYGVGAQPIVPSNNIPSLKDSKGFVFTKKTFQARAVTSGHIFAVGDITDFTYHGLLKRDNWVKTVSYNAVQVLKGTKGSQLIEASTFENEEIITICSLGPNNGMGQAPVPFLGTFKIPQVLAVIGKSKNLFREKAKGIFNG